MPKCFFKPLTAHSTLDSQMAWLFRGNTTRARVVWRNKLIHDNKKGRQPMLKLALRDWIFWTAEDPNSSHNVTNTPAGHNHLATRWLMAARDTLAHQCPRIYPSPCFDLHPISCSIWENTITSARGYSRGGLSEGRVRWETMWRAEWVY